MHNSVLNNLTDFYTYINKSKEKNSLTTESQTLPPQPRCLTKVHPPLAIETKEQFKMSSNKIN